MLIDDNYDESTVEKAIADIEKAKILLVSNGLGSKAKNILVKVMDTYNYGIALLYGDDFFPINVIPLDDEMDLHLNKHDDTYVEVLIDLLGNAIFDIWMYYLKSPCSDIHEALAELSRAMAYLTHGSSYQDVDGSTKCKYNIGVLNDAIYLTVESVRDEIDTVEYLATHKC